MKHLTSVVCAIIKNEQLFIREWAEHYLDLGFDKLYIYEDFGSSSHEKELKELINSSKVELINLDNSRVIPNYPKGTMVQGSLYSYFLNKCKREKLADWIGFFDVDEFMMFEDGWNLEKLEEDFADCGGVLLAWRLYGANGHIERPSGGVKENYTTPMPLGSRLDNALEWNVKSFVNVAHCDGKKHIHMFNGCLRTNHTPATWNSGLIFEKAWLNHYYTKSWEDYLNRIFCRGNMQNNYRCLDKFFKCNPELLPKKKEMVFAQRYRHTASTMWISRELKIISGGNKQRLQELKKERISKKHK